MREMLGYPKIDEDNPYLISRYDGIIIDSKPWGYGLYEDHAFQGTTQTFAEVYELEVSLSLCLFLSKVVCRDVILWLWRTLPIIHPRALRQMSSSVLSIFRLMPFRVLIFQM